MLQVLASLKTMGTRTKNDHLAFETILAALFPDNAKDDGLMRALQELLGVEWDPLHRAELSNEKARCLPASIPAPDLSHHLGSPPSSRPCLRSYSPHFCLSSLFVPAPCLCSDSCFAPAPKGR